MRHWRSLLAPFNLPTMISNKEYSEFSWKTEGQLLSGNKTSQSPIFLRDWQERVLQVPTLTESIFKIIYLGVGGKVRGQFGMRQEILEKYHQCLPPGIWIHLKPITKCLSVIVKAQSQQSYGN